MIDQMGSNKKYSVAASFSLRYNGNINMNADIKSAATEVKL